MLPTFVQPAAILGVAASIAVHISTAEAATLGRRQSSCFPADPQDTIADRINAALNATGATGYSLQLCQDTNYSISSPLKFAFPNQEITTQGFPGPDLSHRATITVNGPIDAGNTGGHTIAVDGTCATCDSVALRYVQINGNRGASPVVGGGNIEFGGDNQNQIVEYVRSYNPRGWSCLHVAEGPLTCANALVSSNDIGPCGTDTFQEWADGISLSCKFSTVTNNTVTGATDGGIVIFGSPGSHVYNNTIKASDAMQLGGINLVDYNPWSGDFTGTIVENNLILGGFATTGANPSDAGEGKNPEDTFIKIGIAMGARTWFGDKFGYSVNKGAIVRNNLFQGAFGYAMAASVVTNWTAIGNQIDLDTTTFIGSVGPNCSTTDVTPAPEPFVFNATSVTGSNFQSQFVNRDADSLTCILPDNDDWWPYKPTTTTSASPSSTTANATQTVSASSTSSNASSSSSNGSKSGSPVPLAVGIVSGVVGAAFLACAFRSWYLRRVRSQRRSQLY